jgi:hypothetical protein
MDGILNGLPHMFVYLDDILIASPCSQSHQKHVAEVLSILQNNGLVINAAKCLFRATAVDFLGHRVSSTGITPLADRVAAIQSFPQPSTIKELQSFLGLVTFYRRFVPTAAKLLLPLTAALGGSRPALAQ